MRFQQFRFPPADLPLPRASTLVRMVSVRRTVQASKQADEHDFCWSERRCNLSYCTMYPQSLKILLNFSTHGSERRRNSVRATEKTTISATIAHRFIPLHGRDPLRYDQFTLQAKVMGRGKSSQEPISQSACIHLTTHPLPHPNPHPTAPTQPYPTPPRQRKGGRCLYAGLSSLLCRFVVIWNRFLTWCRQRWQGRRAPVSLASAPWASSSLRTPSKATYHNRRRGAADARMHRASPLRNKKPSKKQQAHSDQSTAIRMRRYPQPHHAYMMLLPKHLHHMLRWKAYIRLYEYLKHNAFWHHPTDRAVGLDWLRSLLLLHSSPPFLIFTLSL